MVDFAIELSNAIQNISLDFIEQLIKVLCGAVGVGVGVILFTLILKTIVLPFDIYQRVSMRKQSLKMETMRPELEKLQKQYANDKAMYSQKMMELYKKNGYSMFSACLPTILMMVILILAFNELNTFSQYANLKTYSEMAEIYNKEILTYCEQDESILTPVTFTDSNGVEYIRYESSAEDKFVYYITNASGKKDYYVDAEKAAAYFEAQGEPVSTQEELESKVYSYGSKAAAAHFEETKPDRRFLWVKNIWYSDTYWTHSLGSYSDFTSRINKKVKFEDGTKHSITEIISEKTYDTITADIVEEKVDHNGYFVMVVLSIGLMFLSQFISMKSQKAQNELGTVNGQGQSSQKMMMFIMPILFGIFAFQYSAAFSIYMIISSAYSILTMLLSQVVVDKIFNKQEEKALQKKYERKNFNKDSK